VNVWPAWLSCSCQHLSIFVVQIERIKTSCARVYTSGDKDTHNYLQHMLAILNASSWRRRGIANMNNDALAEAALAEITRFLLAGQKIHAIKVYRELTGSSLSEAKEALDRLESVLRLGGNLQAEFALLGGAVSMDTQGTLSAEIGQLLAQHKKIQAIKLYRERTGAGLNEARTAVDQVEARMRTGL
jgi:ribosomal protein L7/L12